MNAAHLIGARDGRKYLVDANGNTHDIIRAIMQADRVCQPYTAALAPTLRGRTDLETCHNLWQFWKQHVKYQEDPDNFQFVKSPRELYHSGEGDCKSYSIALASCLKNLGIPHCYRFVTEERGKEYHHVYIVAKPKQGSEIIIDCVLDRFNYQNPFVKKLDKAGSPPPVPQHRGIGRMGATQAEVSDQSWISYDADYKANFRTVEYNIKQAMIADVKNEYPNALVKRNKIIKFINENFDVLKNNAATLIYLYWDNSVVPFPNTLIYYKGEAVNLNQKRDEGIYNRTLYTALGIRDATIRMMAGFGCYTLHGITLEHMLDRCYNMAKYGQPWKPTPGVPYYNFKTGTFVNTGNTQASLQMTLKIAMCFPAAGGITRPYGEPYLSVAGWYIPNGASDTEYKNYTQTYVWTDAERARIVNNGAGISSDAFAECYQLYQTWIGGNMPALPSITNSPKIGIGRSKRIGSLGVGETVSIIVACISAAIALAKFIKEMIDSSKRPPVEKFLANPPVDFRMEYQTVDGCYIGTSQSACGTMKAKYCPDGSIQCLTENDLGLPENQEGAPANGFAPMGNNKFLLIGGAILIGAALMGGNEK